VGGERGACGRSGGIAATARATGISVPTIRKGIAELASGERLEAGRVRKVGGGRRSLIDVDDTLLKDLERLLEDGRRGDPESLLLWTSKSVRHLAAALRELGHEVHYTTVAKLMRLLGYSLQANVKTREGASHPDRDAQFGHINTAVKAALAAGQPAISVDTKKKGAGRRFQERRARVAAQGRARAGARARLQRQAAGQGDPLRRL
jgi:transposase